MGVILGSTPAYSQAQPYTFTTFAGIGSRSGSLDGTGGGALLPLFNQPTGLIVSAAGNLYVTDTGNGLIRSVTPAGVVTTFAGTAGLIGEADGTGVDTGAAFYSPQGPALDSAGNLYVADYAGATIRKITPAGVVTTVAGTAYSAGSADGTGAAARFSIPSAVAVDPSGNLYVSDTGNQTIRKITPAGVVTTIAGTVGVPGNSNGNGIAASFNKPRGLVIDGSGNLFVADYNNNCIRKITPAGDVSVFVGSPVAFGHTDATGTAATFNLPNGLAIDSAGNLYVADTGNNLIRKVTAAGVVSTIAGAGAGAAGFDDGTGSAARFNLPTGVALDGAGNIYVADLGNQVIRKVTPAGVVTTVAGSGGTAGILDGAGFVKSPALFSGPSGAATDAAGNVYVADTANNIVRKITYAGVVTTLAGTPRVVGYADGIGAAAGFNAPGGVAVDTTGNVYVADTGNHTIRKITPGGVVTTLAGLAGTVGSADGLGVAATFNYPSKLAVDAAGNVYVADYGNHTIRKITPVGVVTTFAGTAGNSGHLDGTGGAASFYYPRGIALDGSGNVYVADSGNDTIRRITPGGLVGTMAGSAGAPGKLDGSGNAARFNGPADVSVDSSGNVFVADTNNSTIRMITPAGAVTTVGGIAGSPGNVDDSATTQAKFNHPTGVAVDPAGNLYVADTVNQTIRQGVSSASIAASIALYGAGTGAPGSGNPSSSTNSGNTSGAVPPGSATGNTLGSGFVINPKGLATDPLGTIVVADTGNNSIKVVGSDGTVTVLAGKDGQSGSTDGSGDAARFNAPSGLAVDSAGNVYVCDTGNATIRKVTSSGTVTTLAGSAGQRGSTDGTGSAALFTTPTGIAIDGAGNLYVTDAANCTIRMITSAGVVTTFAGAAGQVGDVDGIGSNARFNNPTGLTIDANGFLYVADTYNQTIRKLNVSARDIVGSDGVTVVSALAAATVKTIAGSAGISGLYDGTGIYALFNSPTGVSSDSSGNIYVADTGNSCIRLVTPYGEVATVGGTPGISGNRDGGIGIGLLNQPQALLATSSLVVADTGNSILRTVNLSTGAVATIKLIAPTTTTPAVTAPPTTSYGSGGGAPSLWFFALLAALGLVRFGIRNPERRRE